jgi:hypothetical protein
MIPDLPFSSGGGWGDRDGSQSIFIIEMLLLQLSAITNLGIHLTKPFRKFWMVDFGLRLNSQGN